MRRCSQHLASSSPGYDPVFTTMIWLKQLVSDGEMPSTTRLIGLVLFVPYAIVWTVLCIRQNQIIPPDTRIVILFVSWMTGKATQSFAENRSQTPPATTAAAQPQPPIQP